MPEYRRPWIFGGTYFVTIVTYRRRAIFRDAAAVHRWREALRQVIAEKPFELHAGVVLPDHIHLLVALPSHDDDLSTKIGRAKALFTKATPRPASQIPSRREHREADVWQRRFYDHLIRDEDDYLRHLEYIHYNPVKHGHATRPRDWPWSSFHRWVSLGAYPLDWGCGNEPPRSDFAQVENTAGE